jgi:hypothetical protein
VGYPLCVCIYKYSLFCDQSREWCAVQLGLSHTSSKSDRWALSTDRCILEKSGSMCTGYVLDRPSTKEQCLATLTPTSHILFDMFFINMSTMNILPDFVSVHGNHVALVNYCFNVMIRRAVIKLNWTSYFMQSMIIWYNPYDKGMVLTLLLSAKNIIQFNSMSHIITSDLKMFRRKSYTLFFYVYGTKHHFFTKWFCIIKWFLLVTLWHTFTVSGVIKQVETLATRFVFIFVSLTSFLHSSDIWLCWLQW